MLVGILLTLFVGFLWSLVGVCFKYIAKEQLSIFDVSLITNTINLIILASILGVNLHGQGAEAVMPGMGYVLFVLAAAILSVIGNFILQWSMKYCNSSVCWAIGQSSLIVPFLAITFIFREELVLFKGIGTLVILGGMVLLSISSKGEAKEGGNKSFLGVLLALLSFAAMGVAGAMLSATSYLSYEDTAGFRPVLFMIAGYITIAGGKIITKEKGFKFNRKALGIIIIYCLQGLLAQILQYAAMDKLKVVGMNGCFYPIAVGTCIALYSIWSIVLFREKTNRITILGTLAVLFGVCAYCFC